MSETSIYHLDWCYDYKPDLDDTVSFSSGYDFFGLESLSLGAKGPNGNYLMWPSGMHRKWCLYRDSDGALAFERFDTEEECKEAANRWCKENV